MNNQVSWGYLTGFILLCQVLHLSSSPLSAQVVADYAVDETVAFDSMVCLFEQSTLTWRRFSIESGDYLEPFVMEKAPEYIMQMGRSSSVCCRYGDNRITRLNLKTLEETELFSLETSTWTDCTEDLIVVGKSGFTLYTYDGTRIETPARGGGVPKPWYLGYHPESRALYYQVNSYWSDATGEVPRSINKRILDEEGTLGEEILVRVVDDSFRVELASISQSGDWLVTKSGIYSLVADESSSFDQFDGEFDRLEWLGNAVIAVDEYQKLVLLDTQLQFVNDFDVQRDISWEPWSPRSFSFVCTMDGGLAVVYWRHQSGFHPPISVNSPYFYKLEDLVILQWLDEQLHEAGHSPLPNPPREVVFEMNPEYSPHESNELPVGTFTVEDPDGSGEFDYLFLQGSGYSVTDNQLFAGEEVAWQFYKYAEPYVYVEFQVGVFDATGWGIMEEFRLEIPGYPPIEDDEIHLVKEKNTVSFGRPRYAPPSSAIPAPIPIGLLSTEHSTSSVKPAYTLLEDPSGSLYCEGKGLFSANMLEEGSVDFQIRATYPNGRTLDQWMSFIVNPPYDTETGLISSDIVLFSSPFLHESIVIKNGWAYTCFPLEWASHPFPDGTVPYGIRITAASGDIFSPHEFYVDLRARTVSLKAVFADGSIADWSPDLDGLPDATAIAFPRAFERLRELWIFGNEARVPEFTGFIDTGDEGTELELVISDNVASPGLVPEGVKGPTPRAYFDLKRTGNMLDSIDVAFNWSNPNVAQFISTTPADALGHLVFPSGTDVLHFVLQPISDEGFENGEALTVSLFPTEEYAATGDPEPEFLLYHSHFDLWKALRRTVLPEGDIPSEEESLRRFLSGENPLRQPEPAPESPCQLFVKDGILKLRFDYTRSRFYPDGVNLEKSRDLLLWEPVSEEVSLSGMGEQWESISLTLELAEPLQFYRIRYSKEP